MASRNDEVLLALTHKVRFFSLHQIARTWWAGREDSTRRAMKRLEGLGLVARRELPAHPELCLSAPIFAWVPGGADPELGAVSYALQARWKKPVQTTCLYHATRKSARRLGGVGGPIKMPLHATHDLHVGTVYLHYLRHHPADAGAWRSEDLLPSRRGEKVPDAALLDSDGRLLRIIEFGGSYGPPRVEKLHSYCLENGYPYELW